MMHTLAVFSSQSGQPNGAAAAGNLFLLVMYIRGIVKSKGKRWRAFGYSIAAVVVWMIVGAVLSAFLAARNGFSPDSLGVVFGETILLPMWLGTMFTRTPKEKLKGTSAPAGN
jgi:hypothetical protein